MTIQTPREEFNHRLLRLHRFEESRKERYLDGLSDRSVDPTQHAEPFINAASSQRPESPPEQDFPTPVKIRVICEIGGSDFGLPAWAPRGRPSATIAIRDSGAIVFLCRVGRSFIVSVIQRHMKVLVIGAAGMSGRKFCEARAQALGFRAETRFREIIETHVEDECGGKLPFGRVAGE